MPRRLFFPDIYCQYFFLNITIDQCKFAPKRWFNDLTNVTFHKSANIIIEIHMDHLHTTQQLHIYLF